MNAVLKSAAAAILLAACATTTAPPPEPEWRPLFNGQNLEGWTPKFAKHDLGENYNNTFRVRDGLLVVDYSGWTTPLDDQFGHLFFAEPFSHYRIRMEYRFVGEQVAGGPDWALRNNGIMLHTQPPETMERDQSFPDSIEVQLLGSDGVNPRTTANLCTPQSSIVINGARDHTHCIVSASPSPAPGEWAWIEVEVRGDQVVRHIVNGETVMEYSELLLDEQRPWYPSQRMDQGYIAIQAESAPTEIRRIEIMVLEE